MSGDWTDVLSREQLLAAVRETEDALARQSAIAIRLDGNIEKAAATIARLIAEVRRFRDGLEAGRETRAAETDALAVQAQLLRAQGKQPWQIADRQRCNRSTVYRRLKRSV